MGRFTGQPWKDNEIGGKTKDGVGEGAGHKLHSDNAGGSNNYCNDNHTHEYPNGEYSIKVDGKNVGGSNEAVGWGITAAFGAVGAVASFLITGNVPGEGDDDD